MRIPQRHHPPPHARFRAPYDIAVDPLGNLFVADGPASTIRRITSAGVVTTVAGLRNTTGLADGAGSYARFSTPVGLAFDPDGALYVADQGNHSLHKGVDLRSDEPGPTITTQPVARSAASGDSVTFTVQATSSTAITYQWYRGEFALGGETGASLTISGVNAGHAGNYRVVLTNLFGRNTSATATLDVAAPPAGRITNLSILTALSPGEPLFKIGTVLGGRGTRGTKDLVIRAVGPSLAAFGLDTVHPDPKLSVFAGSAADAPLVASNDHWAGESALSAAMAGVGAFNFSGPTSRDAAVAPSFPAGDYVVEIAGAPETTGTVLAELYDATPEGQRTTATPRLINVSLLKSLGTGLVAGFVIGGEVSGKVLVRAVGPGLAPFGLSGTLTNPRLTLYDGAATELATNDDWDGEPALADAFRTVGAFMLESASQDSAFLATLKPGSYTVAVDSAGTDRGLVLLEIYEVP